MGTAGLVAGGASGSQEAHAFKNAVKKVGGVKTPGPAPGELGLLPRGEVNMQTAEDILQLKGCIAKAPNCFTTNSEIFDKGTRGIDPWKFEGKKPEVAMKEVLDVVNAYPPGQGDLKIDGGGFEVKEATDKYIYVVFESLRKGVFVTRFRRRGLGDSTRATWTTWSSRSTLRRLASCTCGAAAAKVFTIWASTRPGSIGLPTRSLKRVAGSRHRLTAVTIQVTGRRETAKYRRWPKSFPRIVCERAFACASARVRSL